MDKKVPTIKEIAQRLNISISTVSRALHDHPGIGQQTKKQVQQLARELNYEPRQAALFFKQRKTFTIGVVLPKLADDFFALAINGIEEVCGRHKYNVLLAQSGDDVAKERQIAETMRLHRVDGVIVSLSKETAHIDHFKKLEEHNIPVIFFDRIPNDATAHTVRCNLQKATVESVDFLAQQGHKRIAFINGPSELTASVERMNGFLKGLEKNKIGVDYDLVLSTDLRKDSIHKAMKQLLALKIRPTAVFTFNDDVSLDAIQEVKKHELMPGKDISFISYANLPVMAYLEHGPMASVEQYPYEQAKRATEILMELISRTNKNSPEKTFHKIELEGKLVAR
jgi:DNA-binding LacI/PurR family transcriptional regulator